VPTLAPARQKTTPQSQRREEIVVCFSHLRWNFVYQRPQHLLSRAAQTRRVLFIEEPVWVEAGAEPRLAHETLGRVTRYWPELPAGLDHDSALAAQRRLVDRLLADQAARVRIAWYYTPLALKFTTPAAFDLVVYDCMDQLSAFAGASPELVAAEQQLLSVADVVFTGGRSLFEEKSRLRANVRCEPSSVDVAHFGAARTYAGPEPEDQAGLPGPRVGWFGVIDERMDLDLLDAAAALRPGWSFMMVGPVVKIDPAGLPRRANIHYLGGKDYARLPEYLAGWDVGLMNFALNEATRFISPTKTPEYLAAGVPVVSTAVRDVVRPYGEAGLVEIAATAEEVVAAAERLMALPRRPWLKRVDAALASMSWDATWARMAADIDGLLSNDASHRVAAQ
jgi:UDP-galactopyranose mutase